MRIIIAGAGEVGMHLARLLSQEEQDITLIDKSSEKLMAADAAYNLLTYQGNPISFATQENAGVREADLFIAVTPFETENVVACEIAKHLGASKTVARIDNYEFMGSDRRDFFTRLGVNTVIYPEYLAAQEIRTALRHNWVRNWFELHDGSIIVVGVKLRESAQIVGMQLREFSAREHNFHVSAIRRHHDIIIPGGSDYLLADDIVYFTTTAEHVETLRELCGKRAHSIANILIIGASRIAIRLVKLLEKEDRYRFKVIDPDRQRCVKMSDLCPQVEVVCGDFRDIDILRDEGISRADAFIALTDSAETNILSCLTAKESGVKKTVAEVENLQFVSEAENLNISTIINKKLLASSAIFQVLLDSDVSDSRCLALADAEVAEIEAKPKSRITHAPVKDLHLPPHEMTLAALVRDGQGSLINGNTQIQPGDRVVVFCLQGSLHKVEKLFS